MQWNEYSVLIALAAGRLTLAQASAMLERSPPAVQELLDRAIDAALLLAKGPKRTLRDEETQHG